MGWVWGILVYGRKSHFYGSFLTSVVSFQRNTGFFFSFNQQLLTRQKKFLALLHISLSSHLYNLTAQYVLAWHKLRQMNFLMFINGFYRFLASAILVLVVSIWLILQIKSCSDPLADLGYRLHWIHFQHVLFWCTLAALLDLVDSHRGM